MLGEQDNIPRKTSKLPRLKAVKVIHLWENHNWVFLSKYYPPLPAPYKYFLPIMALICRRCIVLKLFLNSLFIVVLESIVHSQTCTLLILAPPLVRISCWNREYSSAFPSENTTTCTCVTGQGSEFPCLYVHTVSVFWPVLLWMVRTVVVVRGGDAGSNGPSSSCEQPWSMART